jgi:hypothetical protein
MTKIANAPQFFLPCALRFLARLCPQNSPRDCSFSLCFSMGLSRVSEKYFCERSASRSTPLALSTLHFITIKFHSIKLPHSGLRHSFPSYLCHAKFIFYFSRAAHCSDCIIHHSLLQTVFLPYYPAYITPLVHTRSPFVHQR